MAKKVLITAPLRQDKKIFIEFQEGLDRLNIPKNVEVDRFFVVNDDPDIYYNISNSVSQQVKPRQIRKSSLSSFNLEGYQVVRSQFTQIRYEGPSITISGERISFNVFCMRCFETIGFIQLLLHPAERKIAIRPCEQRDTHSIRWRPDPERKMYSKTISCPHFGVALYSIMDWNPEYMYKIRGVYARRKEEQIIVFILPQKILYK